MAREQYCGSKPFWPWLATIARRVCLDWHRRAEREVAKGRVDDTPGGITPERVVLAGEELQHVLDEIARRRLRGHRALVLREFGGWSYQQIAEEEGVTVESVRASLKRARASLRRSVLHDVVFDAQRLRSRLLRANDQEVALSGRWSGRILSSG